MLGSAYPGRNLSIAEIPRTLRDDVRRYDMIVVGGGPAGSSAAWYAASTGARVLLCDKAHFPRDKPCGDGLTPRAVRLLNGMGLSDELRRFHQVKRVRMFGAGRTFDSPWPQREGFPDYSYVVPRTDLDELVLRKAESAGTEIWEGVEVLQPVLKDELVSGVRVRTGKSEQEIQASVVVAADGASSRLGRSLGMVPLKDRPIGLALRAQPEANHPQGDALEIHLELFHERDRLPGYGWVFPMGGNKVNIGVGLISTYSRRREVNSARLMEAFLRSLPASWGLPSIEKLRRAGMVKGWRLPMGLAVWPPWRPGVLAVGDAAGVIKPLTGAGISKAIESGLLGAETALASVDRLGPQDLSEYERRLRELWGSYYRLGRMLSKMASHPHFMNTVTSAGMRVQPVKSMVIRFLGGWSDRLSPSGPLRASRQEELDQAKSYH